MNRSLLARTKPEFYDEYRRKAERAGLKKEAIAEDVETSMQEARMLLEGKCPKCGAQAARYVNRAYQGGPSNVPGTWVMYRCSTAPPPGTLRPMGACDFMTDLKEGDEAN